MNGRGSRRGRHEIVREALLILYLQGPMTRSRFQQALRLSRTSFEKYVDGYLVSRGFAAVRSGERGKIYTITVKGRQYLMASTIVDPDAWPPRSLLEDVARLLEEKAPLHVAVDVETELGPLRVPVDLMAETEAGEQFYIYIAPTPESGLGKIHLASLVEKSTGIRVVAVVPAGTPLAGAYSPLNTPTIGFYRDPAPENIAEAILEAYMSFDNKDYSPATQRVIRI